jgi:hypothetical protein
LREHPVIEAPGESESALSLKKEIATQASLLRECLEVVEVVANGLCCDLVMSGYGYEVKYDIAHETKNQAAALLPRVRKMVGD